MKALGSVVLVVRIGLTHLILVFIFEICCLLLARVLNQADHGLLDLQNFPYNQKFVLVHSRVVQKPKRRGDIL